MAQSLFQRARPPHRVNLKGVNARSSAVDLARTSVRCMLVISLFVAQQLFVRSSNAAKLAGQDVPAGGKCEIRVPISKYYQDYAAEGGNPTKHRSRTPDVSKWLQSIPVLADFDCHFDER